MARCAWTRHTTPTGKGAFPDEKLLSWPLLKFPVQTRPYAPFSKRKIKTFINFPLLSHSMCDNMLMDDAGRIWMGCHPKGFTFMLHGKHLLDKAPSNVRNRAIPAAGTSYAQGKTHSLCLFSTAPTYTTATPPPPPKVLVFDPSKSAGQGQLREFFLSDGSDLPGSSVAAPWGDLFLVGSVRGDGLLVCDNTAFNERS